MGLDKVASCYIDDLLVKRRESGFGARLAGNRVGCIAYADDITLVSPTVHGLQSMLSICERFVNENMLKFNVYSFLQRVHLL